MRTGIVTVTDKDGKLSLVSDRELPHSEAKALAERTVKKPAAGTSSVAIWSSDTAKGWDIAKARAQEERSKSK